MNISKRGLGAGLAAFALLLSAMPEKGHANWLKKAMRGGKSEAPAAPKSVARPAPPTNTPLAQKPPAQPASGQPQPAKAPVKQDPAATDAAKQNGQTAINTVSPAAGP